MNNTETLTSTDIKKYNKEDYELVFDYINSENKELKITIKESNMSDIVIQILRLSKFYGIKRTDSDFQLKLFTELNKSDNLTHVWIWNIVYNIISWKRNCNNCTVAKKYKLLLKQATNDPLTWLLNRRGFEKELSKNIKYKNRSDIDSAILMIDIDYFKKINDTYWHETWDQALKELSLIFKDFFREYDIICRWWWEEFIVIMPWINIDMAESRAKELLLLVENTLSQKIEWINSKITISIWISMVNKWDETWKHALQRADVALYSAKNSWRNKVMIEVVSKTTEVVEKINDELIIEPN